MSTDAQVICEVLALCMPSLHPSQQPFFLVLARVCLAWQGHIFQAASDKITWRTGQEVDGLLGKWDAAYANLLRAEWRYERSGCSKRPRHRTGCCGCSGVPLELVLLTLEP